MTLAILLIGPFTSGPNPFQRHSTKCQNTTSRLQLLTIPFTSVTSATNQKKMKHGCLFLVASSLFASNSNIIAYASSVRGALASSESEMTGSSNSRRPFAANDVLTCRVTVVGTMLDINDDRSQANQDEQISCIPIVDEKELDNVFPLDLPAKVLAVHMSSIERASLYVAVKGAYVTEDQLVVSDKAAYEVFNELPGHLRRLEEQRRDLFTTGTKTLGVVRISTTDAQPMFSAAQLEDGIFGNGLKNDGVTVVSQYEECSFGKLKWGKTREGVVDIKVNQSIKSFKSASDLVTAVQKQIKAERGISTVASLGDKVLMCLPPGTGSWAASAGVGHWRAQFNNEWCLSLTGLVHELGHTMSLGHSAEDGIEYGDVSGMMGYGRRNANGPRKCFNGYNNFRLGWYSDRTMKVDPSTSPRVYKLATFVDYDKTNSKEPVLINVGDEYFLQYNRAKAFNSGTEEKQNLLTVTTDTANTSGSTNLGGFRSGETFNKVSNYQSSRKRLVVKVCDQISGNGSSPDALMVSIGLDGSACGQVQQPDDKPSFSIDKAIILTAAKTTKI